MKQKESNLAWCFIGIVACILMVFITNVAADLYVSPDGAGNAFAELEPGPLSGIEEKIRELRSGLTDDLVIHLANGIYFIDTQFVLTEEEGGTDAHRIIWEGENRGHVIISGGITIDGWEIHDADKNIYKAPVPENFDTRQFYVNGNRAIRARAPEDDNFETKEHEYPEQYWGMNADGFNTSYDVGSWGNIKRIEAVMRQNWWRNCRVPVESVIDDRVSFQQPGGKYAYRQEMRHVMYLENAYELLDVEGEWYLDPSEDLIYYIPFADEDMETIEAIAANTERVLFLDGAKNITFRNITFAHSTWRFPGSNYGYTTWQGGYYFGPRGSGDGETQTPGGIQLENSFGINFETCIFEHIGCSAITLTDGSSDIEITGCRIEDISGHGIEVGNKIGDAQTTDIIIRNNYIRNTAVEFQDNHGLFVPRANTVTFEHNEMHGFPYSAIAVGWGWNEEDSWYGNIDINDNYVWDYLQKGSDGGGAYLMSSHPGSEFKRNYIRKNNDPGRKHIGTGYMHGGSIYVEDGGSWFDIQNNVCTETSRWLFTWASNCHDNNIQYNWADTKAAQSVIKDKNNNVIDNNIIIEDGNWPDDAQQVMDNAGIESEYEFIRSDPQPLETVVKPVSILRTGTIKYRQNIKSFTLTGRKLSTAPGHRLPSGVIIQTRSGVTTASSCFLHLSVF